MIFTLIEANAECVDDRIVLSECDLYILVCESDEFLRIEVWSHLGLIESLIINDVNDN